MGKKSPVAIFLAASALMTGNVLSDMSHAGEGESGGEGQRCNYEELLQHKKAKKRGKCIAGEHDHLHGEGEAGGAGGAACHPGQGGVERRGIERKWRRAHWGGERVTGEGLSSLVSREAEAEGGGRASARRTF